MQILSGRVPRRSLPLLALAVLIAGAAVGSLAFAAETDSTIQACRHKVTGRLRAVAAAGACRASETPLSWNKEGQPGPTGPTGPPGPKGDPGPGLAKLNGLDGLACTRDDGTNGTVDLEIANDGDVTLLCVTGDAPPPPPPPPPTGGKLVVNEVDYDQVGTDGNGFVEIENTGTQPVDLTDVALVLVDGADSLEYARKPLTGSLAPGAFVVVDVDPQNGAPDGLALVDTSAHTLLDALSYEGGITSALIDGAAVSLVEGTALPAAVADSNTVAGSLIRNPDGKDTGDAASDWAFTTTITRGAANVLTTP